jgi:hypothetical protein
MKYVKLFESFKKDEYDEINKINKIIGSEIKIQLNEIH